MAFEIRPVDRVTFDAIWTPKVKEQLDDIIYSVENWIDGVGDMHWVIDDATRTCCLPVSMANKFDAACCYALVKDGEFALIRKVRFGTYSIAATSAGFSQRIDEVKQLATEALLLGGSLMSGNPDPRYNEDTTKISSVTFVDYVAPPHGD